MPRILVLEDDAREADVLINHVNRYAKETGATLTVKWSRSPMELQDISAVCDVCFMDIDMPGMSGMEAATLLRTYDEVTPIVFVTNLAQYAVRGYEVDAVGFMVKPVSYGAFRMRMDKALLVLERSRPASLQIRSKGTSRVLRLDDVVFAESRGHDVVYHLVGGEDVSERSTLQAVVKRLEDQPFVRISRGVLVNATHVRSYRGNEVRMDEGTVLTFGRTMRSDAARAINDFFGDAR